jgi:hypothetical protein
MNVWQQLNPIAGKHVKYVLSLKNIHITEQNAYFKSAWK